MSQITMPAAKSAVAYTGPQPHPRRALEQVGGRLKAGPRLKAPAELLVPVSSRHAPVPPDTGSLSLSVPFILHGCRSHAVPATWLRQPCSKAPGTVVPQ